VSEPRDKFIDAQGLSLHYLEWGEPVGEPLVLVHGFLDQARSWSPFVAALQKLIKQPLWIIAPDCRGHGDSGWVGAGGYYHFPDYVLDLDRIVQGLGTKTMKLIKTIDVGEAPRPDGIYFDPFNQRVYVFSHPTKDATVIDAKDGAVLGTIDLGGVPEQGVGDGKGMLYVVMQDTPGSVTAVDVKTMKAIAHYSLGDKGRCNGLALDGKNHVLFAACANSGNPPAQPAQPMMVILKADDGKILTSLPLAGGSDGAEFNPSTMEAFSTHGNGTLTVVKEKSPTSFEVEQNLETMNGARTITLDRKTNHILTMSQERGPAPPPPPGGGRGPQGTPVAGSFTILMIGK